MYLESEVRERLDPGQLEGGQVDLEKVEADTKFLVPFTLYLGLSALQFGHAFTATNAVIPALKIQQSWPAEQEDLYMTLLTSSSIVGLSIGCLAGGLIIQGGRRRTIIQFNALGIVACALCAVNQFEVICVGRLIFGLVAGAIITASAKTIEETVPVHLLSNGYGQSTNIFICFFIMVSLCMSMGMPESPEDLATTQFWRVIYLLPTPIMATVIVLATTVYKEDSLEFLVKSDNFDEAMRLISRVYSGASEEE